MAGGTNALLLLPASPSGLVTGTDKASQKGTTHTGVPRWAPGYLPTGDAPRLPMAPAKLARGLAR